jgi:hypothetical protein
MMVMMTLSKKVRKVFQGKWTRVNWSKTTTAVTGRIARRTSKKVSLTLNLPPPFLLNGAKE